MARRQQLETVRSGSVRAVHGKGASIVISGPAGSGRSRLLDACISEGQLCGMRVLRCDPEPREAGPLASARALLRQLRMALGASERSTLTLPDAYARALGPELSWSGAARRAQSESGSDNDNGTETDEVALQRELIGFFQRAAELRPLLIAVDDAERLDTASLQVLSGLALAAHRSKLLLVVSLDESALLNPSDALRMLQLHSRRLPLAILALDDTERLLASVFGEVPNLSGVAHRVHALSGGNPRLTMELAQHLIDCAAIRHEGAAFVLPDAISGQQLPENLAGVLQARVARLSAAAQELCFVLALTAPLPLPESEAYSLAGLSAEAGAAALAELGASYMLQQRPGGLLLRQSAMAEAVAAARTDAERTALHARVAALLDADPKRRLFAAEHYFGAGQADQALAVLLSEAELDHAQRGWHHNYRKLVERALVICAREGRPLRDQFTLRRALAQQIMTYQESGDHAPLLPVRDTLCSLAGLSDWHALTDIADPALRLRTAFARAQARHDAASEHERILPPSAALRQLVTFLLIMAGFASSSLDLKLLEQVPSLAPFAPLSPSIATLELLISSLRHLRAGRTERYLELCYEILQRLGQPGSAGFPPAEARSLQVGVHYGLALTEAVLGRPAAFEHAAKLDGYDSHVINAWRARQIAHLLMCDTQAADAARQQLEQLQLFHASRQFHQGATLEGEFMAYMFADDLLGLRRILPGLEQQAARHPGWRPMVRLVEATLQRVRGRPDAALVLYEQLLAELLPGRDSLWGLAAAGQVQSLVDAGRMEQARSLGLQWIEACRANELRLNRVRIERALAEAKSALGQHAAAAARIESVIKEVEGYGFRGLHLGSAYETRARLALAAGDADACRHYFGKSTEELRIGSYSGVTARLQQLADRARRAGITGLVAEVNPLLTPERVHQELAQCERSELPARALALALTATGAEQGHLYLIG
ncbi:MAG TPA: ATP-binding protein, partial [Polyangiales bacterium]